MSSGREWIGEWRHGRQFQQTDHYGQRVGDVVYQSRGEAAPASGGRVPNPAPGWKSKGQGAGAGAGAEGAYDVVVNRQQTEGAYDGVVDRTKGSAGVPSGPRAPPGAGTPPAGAEGTYDVVVDRRGGSGPVAAAGGTYDVVVNRQGEGTYDVVAKPGKK